MEVIARNLHEQSTEGQIKGFFKGVLEKLEIYTFHCYKPKGRFAILTIADDHKALKFLHSHGQTIPGAEGFRTVKKKLYHQRKPVNCFKNEKQPDPFLLKSLRQEEHERYAAAQSMKPKIVPAAPQTPHRSGRIFGILELCCGQWDYVDDDLAFVPYFGDRRNGRMLFGSRSVFIKLGDQQIEILYRTIHSFTVGSASNPSLIFQLSEAPKIFKEIDPEAVMPIDQDQNLAKLFQKFRIEKPKSTILRSRISALSDTHRIVVGSCLSYRFLLSKPSDASYIKGLKRFSEIPDCISWNATVVVLPPFATQLTSLNNALTGIAYNGFSFDLKFQLQKLAQNGYLSPSKVVDLLPIVQDHLEVNNKDPKIIIGSIRQLFTQLPYPGPNVEAWELSLSTISDMLIQNYDTIIRGEIYSENLVQEYEHLTFVHKATVTPAGMYLYGPEQEVKNRVLRKYAAYPNHFLSVSFLDEDGESLRLDRVTSGEEIYDGRYKKVLEGIINIAGRGYEVSFPKSKSERPLLTLRFCTRCWAGPIPPFATIQLGSWRPLLRKIA